METIKVNMTPCEDIKTIHASQNDNEAREWGFELHNNGEKIDSSSISDQLVFKAYEGGTEEILPTNGSTPTTSPFIGDIKYPQGLLSDQEFLYRESPTEEDGLAKITDIKGNTLVWNQLVQNGNFANTDNWYARDGATLTVSNNVGTLVTTSASISAIVSRFSYVQNHKYLIKLSAKSSSGQILGVGLTSNNGSLASPRMNINPTSSWQEYSVVGIATTAPSGTTVGDGLVIRNNNATAQTVELKNVQVFDLTAMGLDSINTIEEFTSLFPLPFYACNQGTLLSFMGNGIKTVGKNIFDGVLQNGTIDQYGQEQAQANRYRTDFLRVFPSTRYVISVDGVIKNVNIYYYDINKNFISSIGGSLVTTPSNCAYMRFYYDQSIFNTNLQLEMLKSGNSPTSYEPYTSSTLSLPISTYFPNGMDGVGTAYDELTESKAYHRMTRVDLGSLTWYYTNGLFLARISDGAYTGSAVGSANGRCVLYEAKAVNPTTLADKQMTLGTAYAFSNVGNIVIKDSSYTYATAFKSAMSGVYLVYPLETPTETSFTTASLVTENAEIPLSNDDGTLIGKCTEQLSAEPGFHDAKIKLADEDGECYSNKLQLHVERSPQ